MRAFVPYGSARPRGRLAAIVCLTAVSLAGPVSAAGDEIPWAHVYRWRGEVAADVRNNYTLRDTTDRIETRRNETIVGEEVSLGADGWIYHPAFLRFSTEVGLEWNQDIVKTNANDDTTEVDIFQVNFDINLAVLPEKPYPITLFASRAYSDLDPPFSERRRINALRYGGGVDFRELAIGEYEIPTRIFYRHFDTETTGRFLTERIRDEIEFTMENETERTSNRLEYDWEALESSSGPSKRNTNRHVIRADQNFFMDDGGLLSSRFLFSNDDTNDFNVTMASLNENLNLIHTPSLRSNYGYSFNYQENGSERQVTNGGYAGVSHQIYESLVNSGVAGASYTDSDLGQILRVNGGLAFNYTKQIPGGNFGLRFLPSLAYQDDDIIAGVRTITDESHDVSVLPEFELDNLCVIDSTIDIRESVTDIPLVPGQFIILPRSNDCSPARVLITDPAILAVLVSYQYQTEAARSFTTTVFSTGFNLSLWEHFAFDISYTDTNQNILSGGQNNTTLTDSQLLLTHMDLYFDEHRTRLEFERFRSDINPRDRFSIFHNYTVQPTRRSTLGLGLSYAYDKLTDVKRTTHVVALTSDATALFPYGILGRLNFFTRFLSQNELDSVAVGGTISFTYHYGWLRLELQDRLTWNYTVAKENFDQTTNEIRNVFYFRISRPF